jgi:ParB family chromosome partitioning protein
MTKQERINDQHIGVDEIRVGKRLRQFRPEFIPVLAESMRLIGQLMAIGVRPRRGGGYHLVFGWHRLEAAKQLGWTTIWATIFPRITPSEAKLMEIEDNLFALKLSPAERIIAQERHDELAIILMNAPS